ncbi:MAG TPA: hypothetical protein VFU05_19950 [Cyclobacteriaceae bacterium]|nr:hypothetical protein [Cyclobacteriaceae bacterium]
MNPNQITIPSNFVLIKPDKDFTEYVVGQLRLEIGNDATSRAAVQKWSVQGEVVKVPESLFYYYDEQMKYNGWQSIDYMSRKRNASLVYKTEIEVKPGDRVVFDYLQQMEVRKEQGWFEDESGQMYYLIKYDSIIAIIDGDDLMPVNGHVIIEETKSEVEITENGPQYKDQLLIFAGSTQLGTKGKFKRIGVVRYSGKPLDGYMEFPLSMDFNNELCNGDLIIYNPIFAHKMEFDMQQTIKGRINQLRYIHRKDIYALVGREEQLNETAS